MTLGTILPQLRLNTTVEEAVQQKLSKDTTAICTIAQTAYIGEGQAFPLCRRMPLTRLAVVPHLLTTAYDVYSAPGGSDDIIWDPFRDVSLRADLYFRQTGLAGLSKGDVIWFRHLRMAMKQPQRFGFACGIIMI